MVWARWPKYSLNWTSVSSAIQKWQRCQCCSSSIQKWTSRRLSSRRWWPFALKSAKVWPFECTEEEDRGRTDPNRSSSTTGLGRSLVSFVQCGFNEPSWKWTPKWVLARMPIYSLNWTARSSAIQRWQRCQCYSLPTRRWPSLLTSSLPWSMDLPGQVSQSTEKTFAPRTVADRSPWLGGIFVSATHQTELDIRSMTRRSIIVGIRREKGWARA